MQKTAPSLRCMILLACLCVALTSPTKGSAQAAEYPHQRVFFIVGFAVGGFSDTVARSVANRLSERLGQSVIVQNMEGGGGIRAARRVATSPPDGYTILVTTTSLAINETLVPNRGYTAAAFDPVAIPVSAPETLSVSARSSIRSMADLVKEAKAGTAFMGSAGIGSGSHIAGEYFFKMVAKSPVKHIPFAGGNPAVMGLLTGDVTVLAATATALARNIKNGDVIGLGVAAAERYPLLPSVPTLVESGFPGMFASSWTGFFVPAGTPGNVIEKLNREINAVLQEPETVNRIEAAGVQTIIRDRVETIKLFKTEIANWSSMVEAVGITKKD